MSVEVRFLPNALFPEEVTADRETKVAVSTFGERALEGARNAVAYVTGHARASYYWDEETQTLGSTSSFWAFQEYGTVHNVATAPLRRGVEAAGLPWSDSH